MNKLNPALYLVTNSDGLPEEALLAAVDAALANGVTLLQLREKEKSARDCLLLARKVKQLAARYNVPLIIDDRVDIALAAEADGAHVGADDLPVAAARRLLGPDKIIGATAKTVAAALAAEADGADYIGAGAVYPTGTKVKTVLTPVTVIKDICRAVTVPVVAIGGLNADNLDILAGSGVAGVCVVSAIMNSADPGRAARAIARSAERIL